MTTEAPSQFYTGLVSELYDPLVGETASASQYTDFIDYSGQPVLEPFCGSGAPMIELLELGYDIDGLDASADMLGKLKVRAKDKGLVPNVYHQTLQHMDLPRRYRTIFIAGASLILLTSDEEAREALKRMYDHLEPGGNILIPLETHAEKPMRRFIGYFSEQREENGTLLRCGSVSVEFDAERRTATNRLRYERIAPGGETEALERDWHLHWWSQDMFRLMLEEAGFESIRCVDPEGREAEPDARIFVFVARRGGA